MTGLFPFWRRIARAAVLGLGLSVALGGCQLSLPFGGQEAAAPAGPNPVTGGPIEVTELPPAPGSSAPAPAAAKPDTATPAPAAAPVAAPGGKPVAKAEPAGAPAGDAPPAPVAAPAVPEAQKSPAQLACEKRGAVWAAAGNGVRSCVSYTKDSGKQCSRASQCEGQCLARSGTCSPYTPLLGCNEILDDMGRRMTLCLE